MVGSECLFTVRSSPVPKNYLQFIEVVNIFRLQGVWQSVALPRFDRGDNNEETTIRLEMTTRGIFSQLFGEKSGTKKGD